MKSVNIIKLLEEAEKTKIKERKSTDETSILFDKAWNFIDNFIMPNVVKKIELNEYEKGHYEDYLLKVLFTIEELVPEYDTLLFTEEEIDILNSKDRKFKIEIGKRYAELVIRKHTQHKKMEEYYLNYVKPMLEQLHKQNIIIYDTEAFDNNTKTKTKRLKKLVDKIINDKANENTTFAVCKTLFRADYMEKNDVFFSNNKEQKEKFCNCIKNYIEKNYNNIDYKNIDNVNFAEMDEFMLD